MKLRYEGKEPIRLVFPVDQHCEEGTIIEVDGRLGASQDLLSMGFVEIKEKTNKKEGDK